MHWDCIKQRKQNFYFCWNTTVCCRLQCSMNRLTCWKSILQQMTSQRQNFFTWMIITYLDNSRAGTHAVGRYPDIPLNSLAKVRSWRGAFPEQIFPNCRCTNLLTSVASFVSNKILRDFSKIWKMILLSSTLDSLNKINMSIGLVMRAAYECQISAWKSLQKFKVPL